MPRSSTFASLRFLLGGRTWRIAALVVVSTLAGVSESGVITLIAQAAGALVARARRVDIAIGVVHTSTRISTLLWVALALAILRLWLLVPMSILPARIAATVQARLRRDLVAAFTTASWTAQARVREGQFQELMTNQVAQASLGALQATQYLTALLTLAVLMLSALLLNALAAAFILVAAVALFAGLRPLDNLGARRARLLSAAQMTFASGVGEATRVAEETHVFGVGRAQRAQIDALVATAGKLFYRTQMIGNLLPNIYRGLIYVLVVGGLMILSSVHTAHVAALGAVVLLLVRAGGYGQVVQSSQQYMRQALPYVERLSAADGAFRASAPPPGRRRVKSIAQLSFRRVGLNYVPERPVLEDVTFEVSAGEAIGIVGPSGAGKSTLAQLLLRLRDPSSGTYLVNGHAAAEVADTDWMRLVSYVPQEPRLLHATVADNIRFLRPDISDGAVEHAARLARIHDDVTSWPGGYQAVVGPRADAISGGQQQRICIARALVGLPTLLVLDEPASSLDPISDSLLQDSLRALKAHVTLFVIAHRMSTVDMCDRVMVIEGGRLAAFDTPAALGTSNAYYRFAVAHGALEAS